MEPAVHALKAGLAVLMQSDSNVIYILTPDNKVEFLNIDDLWTRSAFQGKNLEETLYRLNGSSLQFVSSWVP